MLHEVSFKSFNERDDIQGWIYVPAAKPKGIVQLIHGFGEHSRRYIHMISAFLDAGYIVAADDHTGHGKTAMVNDVWGDWGDKGPHTMMEDEHTLKEIVCEKYPDLPYFLFGHSMGSFITRDFIAKYGDELSGATLCGTAGIFRGAKEAGEALKKPLTAARLLIQIHPLPDSSWDGCVSAAVKSVSEMNGSAQTLMYKETTPKILSMHSQELPATALCMISCR